MDPVTTAILAAIAAGAAKGGVEGVVESARKAIVKGYVVLKDLLREKFGAGSEVVKAVDGLENKPDSAGRKQTVSEELAAVKASDDPDLLKAAQALLEQIKAQPGGKHYIQQVAQGSYIAQAAQGSTAIVNTSNIPGRKDG
jgi:hypothetical protein